MARPALSNGTVDLAPPSPLPDADTAVRAPALVRAGRVHAVAGPGRRAFAAALAGRLSGAVLWVQESRTPDRLCPPGLAALLDPARLILVTPIGGKAVLQVLEEALRSGAVPLVIGELDRSPDLTAGRRLQLAAGTGGGRGLVLVPDGNTRASAVETRWQCRPLAADRAGSAPQLWELVKNKRGRPDSWRVDGRDGVFRVLPPEEAQPPGPA